jgi:hypothetical protein
MVTNCRREKLSPEEETEYARSEKDCVFNWLKVEQCVTSKSLWGLKRLHKKNIRKQMAQYGQTNYWRRSSRNCSTFVKPRRSKKLSDQVVAEKLLELFKEKQIQQLKKLLMTNLLLCLTENKFKKIDYIWASKENFLALFILNLKS